VLRRRRRARGRGLYRAAAIAAVLILVAYLVCRAADAAHIRALVVQAVARDQFVLHSLRSEDLNTGGGLVEVTAELHRYGRDDVALEAAVSRLSLEPSVSSVTWNTRQPAQLLPAEE
jgi:putative Mg2+ transporter-C (MgtC) family protein